MSGTSPHRQVRDETTAPTISDVHRPEPVELAPWATAPDPRDSRRHAEEVRGLGGESHSAGVLARPTGVGHAITTYTLPIEGRDELDRRGRQATGMTDQRLRGALIRPATKRQMDVLAAYVAAGGSVQDAAELVDIRPSTVKRHLADLRARSGLSTEQLIYAGRASGRLVVPSLEPA